MEAADPFSVLRKLTVKCNCFIKWLLTPGVDEITIQGYRFSFSIQLMRSLRDDKQEGCSFVNNNETHRERNSCC